MEQQVLSQLNDIHLPAEPSIWPLAIGWWLLAVVLIMTIAVLFFFVKRIRRISKQKKMLFAEFSKIEYQLKQSPTKEVIGETNILLRRIALLFYPNTEVASLTGVDWLTFLDKTGKTDGFSQGVGRVLVDAPYRIEAIDKSFSGEALIKLIYQWLNKNAASHRKWQKGGGCK